MLRKKGFQMTVYFKMQTRVKQVTSN